MESELLPLLELGIMFILMIMAGLIGLYFYLSKKNIKNKDTYNYTENDDEDLSGRE